MAIRGYRFDDYLSYDPEEEEQEPSRADVLGYGRGDYAEPEMPLWPSPEPSPLPPPIVTNRGFVDPDAETGWAGAPKGYESPVDPRTPYREKYAEKIAKYEQAQRDFMAVFDDSATYSEGGRKLAEKLVNDAKAEKDRAEADLRKADELYRQGKLRPIPPAPRGSVPKGYKRQFNYDTWEWEDVPLDYLGAGGGGGGGGAGRALTPYQEWEIGTKYPNELAEKQAAIERGETKDLRAREYVLQDAMRRRQEELADKQRLEEQAVQKMYWEIARARMEQEQAMARAMLQAGAQAAQDINASTMRALPYQAIPGQQYYLGFEPGGPVANIARMGGRSYNPAQFRAPISNFNPAEAWQKALASLG